MKIDIPPQVIDDLREILIVLEEVAHEHKGINDSERIIEPWIPSNLDDQIIGSNLTVGLIRKASKVRKLLRL